jgi:hypothetical protein
VLFAPVLSAPGACLTVVPIGLSAVRTPEKQETGSSGEEPVGPVADCFEVSLYPLTPPRPSG